MPFPSTTVGMMVALAVALTIWVSVSAAHAAKSRSLGVRVGVGMAAWLALTLYLSHRNFIFAEATPVYFVLFPLLIPVLGGALLLSQPKFRQLVAAIPQTMLIAPHLLRVIGFNFIILSELGYLPVGFALPAGYGDVITALAVPFVLYLIVTRNNRARQAILGWNLLGLADFIVALTTGPLFIQPYLLTIQQPYDLNYFTMIPIFAVPIFLLTHLYSLAKVFSERPERVSTASRGDRNVQSWCIR